MFFPYHRMMHEERCSRLQICNWVVNRFYYQISVPIKDANVMINCPNPTVRQQWVQRILDHDGAPGGIEAWLALGEACGLSRELLWLQELVLSSIRVTVDAYVNFARRATWQREVACSSLTELFAPEIHKQRLSGWPEHYSWFNDTGLSYFRKRLSEARRDVEHGLHITLDYFTTRIERERAPSVLQFKLNVLWSILDAIWLAYAANMPPFHSCEPMTGEGTV